MRGDTVRRLHVSGLRPDRLGGGSPAPSLGRRLHRPDHHPHAYGTMVHVAEAAAQEHGIDAEIIDLRSLLPLDNVTIVASVQKTGRCLIVHEATRTGGFGAELMSIVQENCFYHLEAPIERVTG